MPDFGEIEQEAKDHSTQVDKGVGDLDAEVDKVDGGRDQGEVDKLSQDAEGQLGGQPGGDQTNPPPQ